MAEEAAHLRTRTGRRAGPTVSHQRILAVARKQFSVFGYEGTTMRSIAQAAGVDTALIHHFFHTKEGLFEAAVDEALPSPALMATVAEGPRRSIGERLAFTFVNFWDQEEPQERLIGVLRSSNASDKAGAVLNRLVGVQLLQPLAATVKPDGIELRAALAGAQLIGMTTMRYVLRVDPLASLPPADVASLMAKPLQSALTGVL
jgi:AcrR family transcriptional regulator